MDRNHLRTLQSKFGPWLFLTGLLFVLSGCGGFQDSAASITTPDGADISPTPLERNLNEEPTPVASTADQFIPQEDLVPTETQNPIEPSPAAATPIPVSGTATAPKPLPVVPGDLDRFGVTISRLTSDAEAAYALGLPFGSALNWNVMEEPPDVPADFWQVVRVSEEGIRRTDWDTIEEVLASYPGSYWVVGNEPDVQWQDNVTPQRYAEIYHDVYTFIKDRDPDAKLVIGGVAQPTPLRRAYLDIVLDTYESIYSEPMPVDVWNVHAFILREESDSWGVGIPPGLTVEEGILYEIEDHDDVQILAQNIREFRTWMSDRGYGDKPLVISEYGILMPDDYGFPPERVSKFMESSFDLFRTLKGKEGYSPDDNRLVQWWFWYSLYDGLLYSTGNLWEEETGQLTDLGQAWITYIQTNQIAVGSD